MIDNTVLYLHDPMTGHRARTPSTGKRSCAFDAASKERCGQTIMHLTCRGVSLLLGLRGGKKHHASSALSGPARREDKRAVAESTARVTTSNARRAAEHREAKGQALDPNPVWTTRLVNVMPPTDPCPA